MTRQELREWRLTQGLREQDVAEMFGLTETDVKHIESGRKAIPENFQRHIKR